MSRTVNWHSRYGPALDLVTSEMGTAPSIRQVAVVCRRPALGRCWWPIIWLAGADQIGATPAAAAFSDARPCSRRVCAPQLQNGKTLKQNIPDGCDVTRCAFSSLSSDCNGRFDVIRFDLRGQVAELPTVARCAASR